jgi:putative oxidoreductase
MPQPVATVDSEPRLLLPFLQGWYDLVIPLSWLVVRIAAGGILALHGWAKFLTVIRMIAGNPVKGAGTQVVILMLVEFVGGLGITFGLFTRFFAPAAAIEMAYLTFVVYWGHYGWRTDGYEYVLMWGLVLFAIALRGGGPYSLDRKIGWEL